MVNSGRQKTAVCSRAEGNVLLDGVDLLLGRLFFVRQSKVAVL